MIIRIILFFIIINNLTHIAKAQNIILAGRISDTTIKYIRIEHSLPLYNLDPFFEKTITEVNVSKDGKADIKFNVEKPTVILFKMLGYTYSLSVEPGDSLCFTVKQNDTGSIVRFSGVREAYYNYNILNEERFGFKKTSPVLHSKNGIQAYFEKIQNIYRSKIRFLKQYSLNKQLSSSFYNYQLKEIEYQKQYYLLSPLVRKTLNFKELPRIYIDNLDLSSDFELTAKHFSNNAMLYHIYRYAILNQSGTNSSNNVFSQFVKSKNTSMKTFILINLFGFYSREHRWQERKDMIVAEEELRRLVRDPLWLKYINKCRQLFYSLGKAFPDNVLDSTKLIRLNDSALFSLRDVLSFYKDSYIYIDFWASWCAPCRNDNTSSSLAKDFLRSKNVRTLYFSLDKNIEDWRLASFHDNIMNDQFILVGGSKSPLAIRFLIKAIPRYFILDANHNIVSAEAPRPTDMDIQALKDIIKNSLSSE